MRRPQDLPPRPPRSPRPSGRPRPRRTPRRRRLWILVAIAVLIILIVSLRSIATFYTDYLWFGSVKLTSVWRHLFVVKLALFFGFAAVFFVALWVSLAVVDRVAASQLAAGQEDELVRRYQQYVAPRALLVRSIVALVVALIAASSAIGQWSNFLLFANGVSFTGPGSTDPQFHKNVGFFVFKLPFLSFLVSWSFVALIVIAIFTVIAHYLNGGIRIEQGRPSVSAQVKVHISVLLACMALVKAVGYYLGRYNLDLSTNGYVQGAGYTDVHARIPAYTLLMVISLLAIVILVVNIWQRGWALPILAVGLWAFVAIVVGAIYPAIVQALKVGPAQNTLEKPYIARNIAATRRAMSLNGIKVQAFAADTSATTASLETDSQSLDDVRLWDPEWTGNTFTKQQAIFSYYSFNTLTMDRYTVDGQLVPMVVGVRQVNTSDLPAQGWVNTHLQYTHGYGMVLSPANEASNGQPVFDIGALPPVSATGLAKLTQPSVYFGLNNPNGGDANFEIANTRQPEVDYPLQNGGIQESHYSGPGGVELNNFVTRAAFALRFGDLNVLISDRLTPQSRVMFVRDVVQMAHKAAPFLSYDSDPYPVLVDGHIDWVIDAYTTTDHYPYAQDADTSALAPNSGLAGQNFNYVRNSVKVVVNAYTGAMTFYDVTPLTRTTDPILQTWEKIFPGMFHPVSQMPRALITHLRYPEDLFTVQAAAYGRYHLTQVQAFYNSSGAWNISQSPGAGSPDAALPTTFTTNAQGQIVSTGQVQRMAPLYETFALPGQSKVSFNLIDAYVPFSSSNERQTLSGFLVAGNDPGSYGKMTVYAAPTGQDTDGPALIDARITQNPAISQKISLLNTNGSEVILGNVLMLPVGQSMLYFRPFYVQSSRNPVPQLQYVIVVYSGPQGNSEVTFDTTLQAALGDVFQGLALPPPSSNGAAPSQVGPAASAEVQSLINQASQDYNQAQADLKAGNFAAYGTDLANLQSVLQQLEQASGASSSSSSSGSGSSTTTTTTTTTTAPTSSGVASRPRRSSTNAPSSQALVSSH
ncbi:MAG TPA: UPF0182 family protein [Acidimicrobiales bacterium]|nr:UPF0182 family protein [Acidimicrobiales bacterium]